VAAREDRVNVLSRSASVATTRCATLVADGPGMAWLDVDQSP